MCFVLSDFHCCQESCINTNFDQSIWLWEPFHSFLVLLQSNSCARISIESLGVIINKFAGSNNGSDCPANTGISVLVGQVPHTVWRTRGFTRQPENKRAHCQRSSASNTTKIPRQEREERKKFLVGEGRKNAEFWASHPSGPHSSGPHPPLA